MKLKIILFFLILGISIIFSQKKTNYSNFNPFNTNPPKEDALDNNVSELTDLEKLFYLDKTINPDIYIVGPGDIFAFNMVGTDGIVTRELFVSPVGDVLIPAVGVVHVDKLTLTNAFKKIRESCLLLYSNSKVNITLANIRKFKIKVIGIHNKQSFYTVSPISRVSDIYQDILSGLIYISDKNESNKNLEISSRNIKLLRNSKLFKVDLVKYSVFGDDNTNPLLNQGDVIEIGIKEKEVSLYGGIMLQGKYELVEGESVHDIINLAGGFTKNADTSNIFLTRFINDTDKIEISLSNLNDYKNTILKDEDFIQIRYKKEYKRQDLVSISGEINFPGTYSIDEGETTINALLIKSGGYTEKADLSKIIINNKTIMNIVDIELSRIQLIPNEDRSDEEKAYVKARSRVNKGSINSSEPDFTFLIKQFNISRDDHIYIPSLYLYIEVLGAVKHPGRFPYMEELGYKDYIDMAGGITNNSTKKKYIIKSNTGQRMEFSNNIMIENGDVIFVAEKIEYNKWNRFKEIMATLGQTAAIIVVIQNAIGN